MKENKVSKDELDDVMLMFVCFANGWTIKDGEDMKELVRRNIEQKSSNKEKEEILRKFDEIFYKRK